MGTEDVFILFSKETGTLLMQGICPGVDLGRSRASTHDTRNIIQHLALLKSNN